jgi:uncharacterized membrane protein
MARLLLWAAFGGAAMYLFDPTRGRRRRALLRDQAVKAVSAAYGARDALNVGKRDLSNRSRGMAARLSSIFVRRKASDDAIAARVRSKMGRYVSHPGAVDVVARDGAVILSGAVLRHEHDGLLARLRSVPGVEEITDHLIAHESAEGVSELQGGRLRRGERVEILQDKWAPGTRLAAGAAGTTLALYALSRKKTFGGLLAAAAGTALLVRSTTNAPLRQVAARAGRGIAVQKTITIDAPADEVFLYLAKYENFPSFMRNVRSVEELPDGKSHWTVSGPAGTTVEWNSVTTQLELNELIAWQTVAGSTVQHAGIIRLEPLRRSTRVHLRMTYNPPAGVLGHLVAKLFGADPKSELDEDLMRLKTTLETGQPPRDAASARRGNQQQPASM